MSFYKHETITEALETCRIVNQEITDGCTCPDEPHQNRMHDLAVDLPGLIDNTVYGEVKRARMAAHAKYGENSIEGQAGDSPRWLAILVEEVGEVAHELTYDTARINPDFARRRLRDELIQVAAVATAWAEALNEGS